MFYSYIVLFFGSIIGLCYSAGNRLVAGLLLFIVIFLIVATFVEYGFQAPKKWKAIANKKKVIVEGQDFAGTLVVKIEK